MTTHRFTSTIVIAATVLLTLSANLFADSPKRRMTPLSNQSTETQAVNEAKTDSTRILAARRAASIEYVNDRGQTVYVDTITGQEWIDSTELRKQAKVMKYPLIHSATIGVNVWDAAMRLFGQHYGLADAWLELSLHNRYKPIFEMGLGHANYTPADGNFTYTSPMSVFFKLGVNYNFMYNSSPDYQFMCGLRYGFSPFSFSVNNVTVDSPYWGETSTFDIAAQHVTVGWLELGAGLRVKLWGPISAGWMFKYHFILHETKTTNGQPWYIPGYGTRGSSLSGTFSISYTLPLSKTANTPSPAAAAEAAATAENK